MLSLSPFFELEVEKQTSEKHKGRVLVQEMGKESPGCGIPRTEGSVYSGYRDTQEVRDVSLHHQNSDLNQRCILWSTEGLETIDAYAPCLWLWFHWYGFVRKFSKSILEELNFIQETPA